MTLPEPTMTDFPPLPNGLRRAGWLFILAGGVVAYVVVLRVMVQTQNISFFPALLLIGSATIPLAVLALVAAGGRQPVIPSWVVVLNAIVGGIVGVVAAGLLEYDVLRGLGGLPMLFVGFIEEAAKLLIPVVLVLLIRPRDPRPGVVVGVAAGMGFAVLETMGYGFQVLLSAKSIAAVDATLLLRGLLSPSCHIAWTGMTAAMLWRIPGARHPSRALWGFLGTYLAAAVLHAAWDASTSTTAHIVIAAISLAALVAFILLAHRRMSGPGLPRIAS